MSLMGKLLCIAVLVPGLAWPGKGWADGPQEATGSTTPDQARAQLPGLLRQLDSPEFTVRQQAAETLEEWTEQPELQALLARRFQELLLDSHLSFEVRWHVQRWSRQLPAPGPLPVRMVDVEAIDRLFAELEADEFAARLAAEDRLRWLLGSPRMVCPILQRAGQRLADPALSTDSRQRLEAIWDQVFGVWLALDPAQDTLPRFSREQIEQWADQLASPWPAGSGEAQHAYRSAERQLRLALARDENVPIVRKALETRMANPPDRTAILRLEALHYWTKPALVAEYWHGHRQVGEQHLIVGEPSQAERAIRPSHFDYIDDRVARCVSGNSLSPGEYPSGVAFPHPTNPAFFHLVNLPTPRRRMLYGYESKTDDAVRLTQISRRTRLRWLEEKHVLNDRDVEMLEELDWAEASRFIGQYVNRMPDEPDLTTDVGDPRPSRHAMLCLFLVQRGTQEAIPGLLNAIERNRFLRPTRPPYELPWCAALAIAQRDPWPEVDTWLAGLLVRKVPLRIGDDNGPELGATAAGLLLRRHDRQPEAMGLEATGTILGDETELDGYRFPSDEVREEMQRWWSDQVAARTGT